MTLAYIYVGKCLHFIGLIRKMESNKNCNKVELLAPAGDIECFYEAVHAGADAVYLAGDKFGARAYADNFTTEQLCEAIRYGHLYGVKIYLTLNTLIKQREFEELYSYVAPFYEAGLDGIIVQDLGVVKFLKENFPLIELHASTQMTVTGAGGAKLLKNYGLTRVVPARELSLNELKAMKEQTGIEMEIFIHGAMCYAYSGQCLFSSVLGGRSGNRGRCAGPCRLPYQVFDGKQKLTKANQDYPLSLKDLCTIQILPELILAGMDSFKIEGRMKSPEYVAVVTAIYRKYIDLCYELMEHFEDFCDDFRKYYHVDSKDLTILQNLYVRTNLQDGYFHKHNGPELVTLYKPNYGSFSDSGLEKDKNQYRMDVSKLPIQMRVDVNLIEPVKLSVKYKDTEICVRGFVPQRAQNKAMTVSDIKKQIAKLGNTPFVADIVEIHLDGEVFIPNRELNELRRNAMEQLMNVLAPKRKPVEKRDEGVYTKALDMQETGEHQLAVSIMNFEQYQSLFKYINYIDQILIHTDAVIEMKEHQGISFIKNEIQKMKAQGKQIFLVTPRVMRQNAVSVVQMLLSKISKELFDGFVINSLEGLAMFQGDSGECFSDAGLYAFNSEACAFLKNQNVKRFTIPYELNYHEIKEIHTDVMRYMTIYGYLPLMESAGCVVNTLSGCKHKSGIYKLVDRYKKTFFVKSHCSYCDNTIYNSVPMNLMSEHRKLRSLPVHFRIDFTVESSNEVKQVLDEYINVFFNDNKIIPKEDYTKGYFKRGVE